MNQEAAARENFAAQSTDSLVRMWEREERLPWAEALLREELQSRGLAESELDQIVSRRDAIALARPPSERESVLEYGLVGRFVAVVLAFLLGNLFGHVLGPNAGSLAFVAVLVAYMVVFGRRAVAQLRAKTSRAGTYFLVYQCLELAFLALVCLLVLWTVFRPAAA